MSHVTAQLTTPINAAIAAETIYDWTFNGMHLFLPTVLRMLRLSKP